MTTHAKPALHNAMWPGLVGKGPDSEPPIDLDTMLRLTADTEVNGTRFDGVDLFLSEPHTSIDASNDDLKKLADKVKSMRLRVGSLVAPVWPPTGGGSAMGNEEERGRFLTQVKKSVRHRQEAARSGRAPVRRDSHRFGGKSGEWSKDPAGNTRTIADTFRRACDIAEQHGERLAAEGEICWGGMHSWKRNVELLEMVNRPRTLGFQADMAHTLLFTLGYNAPEDRILPKDFDWSDGRTLDAALKTMTARPSAVDHRLPRRAERRHRQRLRIARQDRPPLPAERSQRQDGHRARRRRRGFEMSNGQPTRAFAHICWDGCMFSNDTMMNPQTWRNVLSTMMAVRDAHGWD